MLHFLMGGVPYLFSARTHEVITPAAILSTAYVPSKHHLGRMVQFKVATSHIWMCHYTEQELKMLTGYSAVLQMPVFWVVWEGGRWSHAEAEDGNVLAYIPFQHGCLVGALRHQIWVKESCQ